MNHPYPPKPKILSNYSTKLKLRTITLKCKSTSWKSKNKVENFKVMEK